MPFPDDSIDYLYSSHLLEHLFWEDAKKLLKEACRVLKKGGILRLCIPDLEYAMSLYREGDKERALRFFFEKAEASSVSYHRYMYDFDMLQEFLEEAGFASIARCRFRRGKTPDTDKLEYRAEESLFVEATK